MAQQLQLTVQADWSEIERVNSEVATFLRTASLSDYDVDTYTMVVCELTENGIKYGKNDASAAVTLHVTIGDRTIVISAVNGVTRNSQRHLRELDRTLQWVRGFQDPFEAYLERVKQIAREPLGQSRSCLGIVRIAYEGRAAIDFVLGEDDTLTVSVVASVS